MAKHYVHRSWQEKEIHVNKDGAYDSCVNIILTDVATMPGDNSQVVVDKVHPPGYLVIAKSGWISWSLDPSSSRH